MKHHPDAGLKPGAPSSHAAGFEAGGPGAHGPGPEARGARKRELTEEQRAVNRANLEKARAAQRERGYEMTGARLEANRRNAAKGREVYRRTIQSMPPEQRGAQYRKNLEGAQNELKQNGQNLYHGMTCASLEASLQAAGEKLEDLRSYCRRIKEALLPRDPLESGVVRGLAEGLWRRLRGLRLAGHWEARKLAAVLGKRPEAAPAPAAAGDAPEVAKDRALERRSYAQELAYDILQVFERTAKLMHSLSKVQRHMMVLAQAFSRRSGEPLLRIPYCGEKREQEKVRRDPGSVGNPFARGMGKKRGGGGGGFNRWHNEVSNVKGLGKAESVATPAAFSAALLAAMGGMSEEALAALKDLAEAVCARLRLLEEEALREAAELAELLVMEPEKGPEIKGQEEGQEERQDARQIEGQGADLKVAATSGATSGAAVRPDAGVDTGATSGATTGARWRGFWDAQEILKSRMRGSRRSKAFGVCLAMGILDIMREGDNRMLRAEMKMERALLACIDRWAAK